MNICITQYPFFREGFVPEPCEEEKEGYVGLLLKATNFVSSEELESELFPFGIYMVPFHLFILELTKLDELTKLAVMPRWVPYLDGLEQVSRAGGLMSIAIAADCCEEINEIN